VRAEKKFKDRKKKRVQQQKKKGETRPGIEIVEKIGKRRKKDQSATDSWGGSRLQEKEKRA